MRTYNEWLCRGRVPRKGERASYYRVLPDGRGIALFAESQTEELLAEGTDEEAAILTAEDWHAAKQRPPAPPRMKIRTYKDGVAIWVGNQRPLIKMMQDTGYRFDRHIGRWCKSGKSVEQVTQALREWGATVEVEA